MEEALVSIAGRISVDPKTCFTDSKGRPSKGIEKRARGWLLAAAPLLGPILEEGEVVRLVTPASSPYSVLELFTTGWVINTVKRCLLVVTDRRILHLPTTSSLKPKRSISQIRFGDLQAVRVKGALAKELRVTYRNGSKETFRMIPGGLVKQLRQVLEAIDPAVQPPGPIGRRHYLCPSCRESLENLSDDSRCRVCGLQFKSKKRALIMSLLLPGGGYFYTGHPVLGLFDALVEGALLLFLLGAIILAATGEPDMASEIGLFGVLLTIEKLITIYHSSHYVRELQPADRSFRAVEVSLGS